MTGKSLLFVAALCLAASASAQKGKIQKIVLERKPCFGTCPVYKLTLYADGTAEYDGERFAPRQGAYKGTFPGRLDRIAPLLDRWGFWKLKPRYSARITDVASQVVTVVTDKGTKTVVEEGAAGPEALFAIQTLLDGLAANVKWTKK